MRDHRRPDRNAPGGATMTSFVDPRVRMRTALQQLVHTEPHTWHAPTLTVFRNRLLDQTGSDARPLAELLVEALQRGWRERFPPQRLEPARWDAMVAPFVMQWSAERFVQPEMAQWAVESWALAFDVIAPEQLRIAPPLAPIRPNTSDATPSRESGTTRVARGAPNGLVPTASRSAATPLRVGRVAPGSSGARVVSKPSRAAPYTPLRTTSSTTRRAHASGPDSRVVWGIAIAAAVSYVGFLGRIAWGVSQSRREAVITAASASTPSAVPPASSVVTAAAPTASPATTGGAPTARSMSVAAAVEPTTIVPAKSDSANAFSTAVVGASPGVPSITGSFLAADVGDRRGMVFVEPTRRAQGSSRTTNTVPSSAPALAFDEIFLNDGSLMRGRVEIVRAGVVVFRDQRTGLRHELRKDDIDRIITEFGTLVRFRVADSDPAPGTPVEREDARTRSRRAMATRDTGPRGAGVAGLYTLRYAEAVTQGSRECAEVWRRAPNSVDRAMVRHLPGADTLTFVFEGGDSFLSNMDREGYFASTFRIVPDQARSSTALTTRLTGQFLKDGAVALQVSIVFFRRMRTGEDLACTVNINATGKKSPQ